MMTRNPVRFPTLKSCLDDFMSSCVEDAAEDQELDPRWDDVDWNYPFRVVSYTEAGTPGARGFLTHADAINYFHRIRIWPGEVLCVQTREGLVTHSRSHTIQEEIEVCWDQHASDKHCASVWRDYQTGLFLRGITP